MKKRRVRKGRLPVLSLFSGSGGLDQGFIEAKFDPLLALDFDARAVATYNRNHRKVAEQADLTQLSGEDVLARWKEVTDEVPAGVIGGPPCQAFSLSNVYLQDDDPRAKLIYHYASIVKAFKKEFDIDFFMMENVAGLTSKRHQPQYQKLLNILRRAGFKVFPGQLDAQFYGVPQTRPRRIVVGLHKAKFAGTDFEFPEATTPIPKTVRDAIGSLPEPVFFSPELRPETIPYHPNHWALRPKSPKFKAGIFKEGQMMGRCFRVLHWDKPSWTVAYGHREVHVHPKGHRRLSIHEAMLLQGFPQKYELLGTLSDQIRLVSDAVPPPLGKAVAKSIHEIVAAEPVDNQSAIAS